MVAWNISLSVLSHSFNIEITLTKWNGIILKKKINLKQISNEQIALTYFADTFKSLSGVCAITDMENCKSIWRMGSNEA
jgi:hypothetical protein